MWWLLNHPPVFLSFSASRLERRGCCATRRLQCLRYRLHSLHSGRRARARAVASSLLFDPTSHSRLDACFCCRLLPADGVISFSSPPLLPLRNAPRTPTMPAERKKESLLLLTFQTRIDTLFCNAVYTYQARNPLKFSAGMIFPFWLCKRVFL